MSIAQARAHLARFGLEGAVREFAVSSATVALAASALGVTGARIAKTLSFYNKEKDGCFLIVAAGDARVDNRAFKARFGCKASMLSPEAVLAWTGHAVGGVCPFGIAQPAHVAVYLDVSLKRFATVFPACGSANSAIEMDCETLYTCAGAQGWVDVCKSWQEA
nr:YbaK/EbsC family protein [Maliibacterium massiliense]